MATGATGNNVLEFFLRLNVEAFRQGLHNAVSGLTGFSGQAANSAQGVAQLGAQTQHAGQSAATLGTHAQQAGAAVGALTGSAGQATAAVGAFGAQAQQAGQAADNLGTTLAKMAASLGAMTFLKAAAAEFTTFESAMLKVQALSGATGADFDALGAKAKELGASTKYTAAEAAGGMGQLAAAGYNTSQILDAIGPAMYAAAAGGSDLAETADQLTNIMGAFQLEADQAGRVADVLTQGFTGAATTMSDLAYAMKPAGAVAKALGYSLEETVSVLQSLANVGYKGEQAGTILRNAMSAFLDDKAADKLEAFGVKIKDAEGNVRKFADILEDMGRAGVEVGDMLDIFGAEAGPGIQAILGQGAQAIRDYEKALLNAGGRAKEVADHMQSGLEGALNRVSAAWSELRNSFGEAIAPTISKTADALGALANQFSAMPTWAKQALAAGAVFAAFGVAAGAAKAAVVAMCTQSAAAVVGMVGKIQAAFVLLAANPWVAALTAFLGAAVVAWQTFGKSALDASRDHARAAAEMGKSVEAANKQVAELKALQKTLLESAAGTDAHRDAEERLARVLPEANTRIDAQGRVLATLTNAADENNKKLNELIRTKEKEAGMFQAQRLEQQARAYDQAGRAVIEYAANLRGWYGHGEQAQTTANKFWVALNKFTGTYDKNIAKGAEYRANLDEQKTAWEGMLRSMARSGTTAAQVSEMLNGIHLDPETKSRIVRDYIAMMHEVKSASDQANKDIAEGAQAASKEEIEARKKAIEEMTKQYADHVKAIRSLQMQIADSERSLAAELRNISREGMSDAAAYQDRIAEAKEYQRAAEEAARAAQRSFAQGDIAMGREQFKVAIDLAREAKSAYAGLATEVKSGEQVIVSLQDGLETKMQGVKQAGEQAIDLQKRLQQAELDAAEALKQKAGDADLTKGLSEAEQKWLESFGAIEEKGKETAQAVDAEFRIIAKQATVVEENWSIAALKTKGMWVEVCDELRRRLDEACKPRTVTVYTAEVVKRAAGGLVGAFRRGGKLPGYGGGDRIQALLEAGEYVIRKEAVARFGAGLFESLNNLRLPALPSFPGAERAPLQGPLLEGAVRRSRTGGVPPPAPVRTVNINLTLPSGHTYRMTTDEATAARIERERDRWWALRSSNRVKPSAFARTRG